MESFLIIMFIVYGMSLIWVQGSIFSNLKSDLSKKINELKEHFKPDQVQIHKLIEEKSQEIDPFILERYLHINDLVQKTSPEVNNFGELIKVWNMSKEQIQRNITTKRFSLNPLGYIGLWIFEKFYKLWTCMMCSSFWIGLLISVFFNAFQVTIFGTSMHFINSDSLIIYNISIIFMGFVFSGTTWIIHSIVDLLDELKSKIIDKR